MKLIFRKKNDNDMTILIHDGIEEKKFSYIDMVKSLLQNNHFEESEFSEAITDKEKESINKMLADIKKVVYEKSDDA
ncbi:MAG: hypothetical protein GY710_27360 [Desulfobacteraceae bacterium]|nr:hypothetical protein [Desulfobacteraceae bacterium]